jgi:hypothetical protein
MRREKGGRHLGPGNKHNMERTSSAKVLSGKLKEQFF